MDLDQLNTDFKKVGNNIKFVCSPRQKKGNNTILQKD